jgi:hypothetical protein
MNRVCKSAGIVLMVLGAIASAQTAQPSASVEISPGFKLRPVGVIDIGDAFAEVNYYDAKWTIAQQHDKFVPGEAAPATQPSVHEISGVLTTAAGPAKYSERVEAIEGGIKYSAVFSSEKPLDTNELSMAFILPLDTFGGKQIVVDAQPQKLSKDAPAKGLAMILQKDDAQEVDVPTPRGTLAITGDFKFLIQDDREWGDPRYSMRLFFTPGSGQIKESKIELMMKWKPANG